MSCTMERLEEVVQTSLSFKAFYDKPAILAYTPHSVGFTEKEKELFQIFDRKDRPVVVDDKFLVFYRGECHGKNRIKGLYHRGVNVLFMKDNQVYIPTRAEKTDTYPGFTEFSASEHSLFREGYKRAGVRGSMEELGEIVNSKDLVQYLHLHFEDSIQAEQVKYYILNYKGEEIRPKAIEIAKGRWYDISELKNLLKEDESMAELHFRPDHLPGLKRFLRGYSDGI
jgi:isopentenyldiphosphate isomerase